MATVRVFKAFSLLALIPAHLVAQQVGGRMIDARNGSPLAGVVLYLLDSSGHSVATTVSRPDGSYTLLAPSPGVYRVRSIRIGFRPTTGEPVQLSAGDRVHLDIPQASLALSLDTVRVVSRSACRNIEPSAGSAAFVLWEQTRAALEAALLTSRVPVTARVISSVQEADPETAEVVRHSSTIIEAPTMDPWSTLSPEQLHDSGYVVMDGAGTVTFVAPDLKALLSRSFLTDHCFWVGEGSQGGEVALLFEPTPTRRRTPEIAGALAIDRATGELRRVVFEYRNLPRQLRAGSPGGQLEFARTTHGQWLISRWNVRVPVFQTRHLLSGRVLGGRPRVTEQYLDRVRLEGGELALLVHAEDTLWSLPAGRISGEIVHADGSRPGEAAVAIQGAPRAIRASEGRFSISGLPPGTYALSVRTPALEALGIIPSTSIVLGVADTAVRLQLPSIRDAVERVCGPGGAVMGRVLTSDSAMAAGALVSVHWSDERGGQQWRQTEATRHGYFRVCELPAGAHTVVAAHERKRSDARLIELGETTPFAVVDLALGPAPPPAGTLIGRAFDAADGRPLAGVSVVVEELSRGTASDSAGAYTLGEVAHGTHRVIARRLGYKPVELTLRIDSGAVVRRDVVLERVRVLDTVSVVAARPLNSFEENRRIGLGQFLDRAALARYESHKVGDVVARLRGAMILRGPGNQAGVISSRGAKSLDPICLALEDTPMRTCNCAPAVYLDKVRLFDGKNGAIPNLNAFLISSIEAIEFYTGPSQTPLEYSTLNSNCGVLVLHTRRY